MVDEDPGFPCLLFFLHSFVANAKSHNLDVNEYLVLEDSFVPVLKMYWNGAQRGVSFVQFKMFCVATSKGCRMSVRTL